MIKQMAVLVILLLIPVCCIAQQEIVVIKGTPIVQNKSSFGKSESIQLSESQKIESRLIITKRGITIIGQAVKIES